jgi:hypothetical protein
MRHARMAAGSGTRVRPGSLDASPAGPKAALAPGHAAPRPHGRRAWGAPAPASIARRSGPPNIIQRQQWRGRYPPGAATGRASCALGWGRCRPCGGTPVPGWPSLTVQIGSARSIFRLGTPTTSWRSRRLSATTTCQTTGAHTAARPRWRRLAVSDDDQLGKAILAW